MRLEIFCELNNYLFKYIVILSVNITGTIISAVLRGKVFQGRKNIFLKKKYVELCGSTLFVKQLLTQPLMVSDLFGMQSNYL